MRAFDAGASGVGFTERGCCLLLAHGLKRLVVLARLQAYDARLPAGHCCRSVASTDVSESTEP